jgi:SH3-like domain-containing protein
MHAIVRTASFGLALLLPAIGHAIEFGSVSEPAVLFDTPSDKGKRLFIVATGTPVEIVVTLDKWVKIRDPGGAITWIERRALADKRTVIVTESRAVVRQQPAPDAPAAFEVVKDVVLDVTAAPAEGWVRVRHKDGASGFLRIGEVWGF